MAFNKKRIAAIADNLEEPILKSFESEFARAELFARTGLNLEKAEQTAYSGYAYWKSTLKIFRRNKVGVFCLLLIITILAFTFLQPLLPGQRTLF
ncbi:MAG: hypothetical protein FWG10_07380 [Eubacteriaceae bacterium]|nr:hypothetical protein [Eubacteriaceae bacterium]